MTGPHPAPSDPAELLDQDNYSDDDASYQSSSGCSQEGDEGPDLYEFGDSNAPGQLTLEDDSQLSCLVPDSFELAHYEDEDEGEGQGEDAAAEYSTGQSEQATTMASEDVGKKRKKRVYTICLSSCKYDVVRDCARKLGLKEVEEEEDWNVFWTDTAVSMDRACAMRKYQKINHFPGMSEICRKDCLARNLGRMRRLFPKEFNISPRTWVLPADYADLQAYARSRKHRTYILKPDAGCQGRGIWFTRSVKDVKPTDNQVCQLYVSRPFLIDGFKFDLRVYALVTGCDPFRIFVYKDGLARFTTVKYRDPTAANLDNVYMHLTNYAVQKNCTNFVRNDEECGTKRRISTINRWLTSNGYDTVKLWSDVDDVIIKTVLSAHGVLRHNYRSCFPDAGPASACFEILGFDIILDRSLRPIVLEVNHSPSFSTDSQLDLDIKSALIWDTLRLVNIGAVDKRKAMEEERRKARDRLFQRASRREARDDPADSAQLAETQRRYEDAHLGNYRRIYPPDSGQPDPYERFLTQAGSIYHETAAARARADCARQLRRDLERKWAEEREIANRQQQQQQQVGGGPAKRKTWQQQQQQRKQLQARPESPTESASATESMKGAKLKQEPQLQPPTPQRSLRMTKRTATSFSLASREVHNFALAARERTEAEQQQRWAADTCRPQPIVDEEEIDRLSGLLQRDNQLRSMGVTELVYRMLHCTPGTMAIVPPGSQLPAIATKPTNSSSVGGVNGGGLRSARTQQQQMLMLMQLQRQATAPDLPAATSAPLGRTAAAGHAGRGATLVYHRNQQQPNLQSSDAIAAVGSIRRFPNLTSSQQQTQMPQQQQQQQQQQLPPALPPPQLFNRSVTTVGAAAAPLSVVSAPAPVAARAATADLQQQQQQQQQHPLQLKSIQPPMRDSRSQRLRGNSENFERQTAALIMR